MAHVTLTVEVEEEVAEEMESICKELGITVEEALATFIHEFIKCGGFPFEVTEEDLKELV